MSILFPKQLKAAARQSLQSASYNPRKLALIHSGIATAVMLLISVLNLLLSQQIGATGGLSGMGLRAVLSTAQSTLSLAASVALPFWELGFLYACLQIARNEQTGVSSLAEGFRRFGPILRLQLLKTFISLIVMILAVNISSMIFIMTPLSDGMLAAIESMPSTESLMESGLTVETMMPVLTASAPLYLIMMAVSLVLLIPISYRFRMASFYLLSGSHRRALVALGASNRMMTGNRLSLFKLDLSLWWYYGCIFLLALVANMDSLALFGIPISEGASFLFYGVYLLGQLLLAWQAGSYVQTTYAHAYDALTANALDAEQPMVKNFPWGLLPDKEQ